MALNFSLSIINCQLSILKVSEPNYDVIVIGAGASGLMAAGQSAWAGARTLVIEKMDRPGIKLSITGKGRCNITNTDGIDEFIKCFGKNGRYLRPVFFKFFNNDLISFFESINVPVKVERGGRVFTLHEDSRELVHKLQAWAEKEGAKILFHSKVTGLIIANKVITGIKLDNDKTISAKAVIIAAGGSSYPATGSAGEGYLLAGQAGHLIIKPLPALVPVVTKEIIPPELSGLQLQNINLSVIINGKKKFSEFGEMNFTKTGLSGPVVLTISRKITGIIEDGNKIIFSIDLKPALDENKLDARLLREISEMKDLPAEKLLNTFIPFKLINYCFSCTGIDKNKKNKDINSDERKKIKMWLKDFRFEIQSCGSFDEAIITQGGVGVKEIDFQTMRSKLVDNLFFSGEVIDIDAITGGYNLQAAFSTGWLAGRMAADLHY